MLFGLQPPSPTGKAAALLVSTEQIYGQLQMPSRFVLVVATHVPEGVPDLVGGTLCSCTAYPNRKQLTSAKEQAAAPFFMPRRGIYVLVSHAFCVMLFFSSKSR